MPVFDEEKQNKKINELHLDEAEGLAQVLAQRYGLPYVDLTKVPINTDALLLVSEAESREAGLACFKASGKNIDVAILTPNNPKVQEVKNELAGKNFLPDLYMVSQNSLESAWERYSEVSSSKHSDAGIISISDDQVKTLMADIKHMQDVDHLVQKESAIALQVGGISAILEIILAGSLALKASDIHIEPQETDVRLRYRLDGVLQDITSIHPHIYHQILSRIKLVSGLKLNVKKNSQDGRFSIKVGEFEIEIRTSVIPSNYGESIVMRVLDPRSLQVSFENLGVEPHLFSIFEREISKPNGLVLLTGPTGSGKTTTLYSFLSKISTPENKVITIEDPVEYHLKGINQTQVSRESNYTFLSGLRAALRQDPDVIMVGEIRDGETAKIAINSALTGHLVFSSLHTNNAAGAIPRLIDLGISSKIITSALTLSIAQRLIRKLCVDCRKEDTPTADEQKIIDGVVETVKKKRPDFVIPDSHKCWRATGCDKCNNTGYKGRVGIFEAIYMDDAIAKTTIENPSEKELKISAIPQGVLDMRQDGILKVLGAITSLDEVGRVVDLYEEFI